MNIVDKIKKKALKKGDIKTHYLFFRYVSYGVPKDLIKRNVRRHEKTGFKWFKGSLEPK